ncbi:putative protein TPRXL [Acanthopagrus latus]|uniref:putative protein TPRXL n=1 Tax=Acanthopagrus latus TaxID=8177 RepID=UPI00187CE52D|nr:putative protein TPRXL [Acanthopagrus latus]
MCVCAGSRRKERLVSGDEEEDQDSEESRRTMDISLLREQYRSSREAQRRHTQVLLLRTVLEEVSEAVSIIPVAQGLTSSWEPNCSPPPAVIFEPDPTTYDPWHVHLGLHRRSLPAVTVQLTAPSLETTNTDSSSRCSSSSSEDGSSRQDVVSPSSSRPTSPYSSSTTEEDPLSTGRSRGDPEKTDPVQVPVSASLDASELNPGNGSRRDHPDRSDTSSDESSTPVASITCSRSSSTSSLHEDLNTDQSAGRKPSHDTLQTSSTSPWTGSREFSAPARFTRQLSVGGLGSSMGIHLNQNYHPFPNRKTPRISEAARRLGMYSSF